MTPETLLDYCRKRHVRLWIEGDALCYNFPKGAITSRILDALKEHKAQVIERLSEPSVPSSPPAESLFAVCSSPREIAANCKQEINAGVEPIAWEGDIPIYVYPGEKCIRCNHLPAVGTPECPRWCQVCYQRDQDFWKTFYAGKPFPTRSPITYERSVHEEEWSPMSEWERS